MKQRLVIWNPKIIYITKLSDRRLPPVGIINIMIISINGDGGVNGIVFSYCTYGGHGTYFHYANANRFVRHTWHARIMYLSDKPSNYVP